MRRAGLVSLVCLCIVALGCRWSRDTLSKDEAVRQGDAHLEQKQFGQAIAKYRLAIGSDPKDGAVRLKLAAAYRLAAQWPQAAAETLRAAELLPIDREAQLQAVEALLSISRFVDALDRIRPIVAQSADDPRALVLLASAKAHLSSYMLAIVKFDEGLRQGADLEAVRLHFRQNASQDDDREAESALRRALQVNPQANEARLALTSVLWATGRFDEGAEMLKAAADLDPRHTLLSRALGLFYAFRGKDAEAEHYLRNAFASGERESGLALADFYWRQNRIEEAQRIVGPIADREDTNAAAALRAAELELRLGQAASALQRAEKVLKPDSGNANALRIKAHALLAVAQVPQALAVAEDAVRAAPRSSEAHSVLAKCLQASGDPTRAFEELSEALRLDPKSRELPKTLADLALTTGRHDVGLGFARDCVRLNPSDRACSILLVKALIGVGDLAAADRTLVPLLLAKPTSADLLILLAQTQSARGLVDTARTTYLQALGVDRTSIDALSGLVDLEIRNKQVARIRQRVNDAVSEHPMEPRYRLLGARVAMADNDPARAEGVLRPVLEAQPNHIGALLLVSDALARQNRHDEAKSKLELGLTQAPWSLDLQIALAQLLEYSNRLDEARARYESILAKHPQAHAVAAMVADFNVRHGGNLDVALGLATRARQHLPKDPVVSDILGWVYVQKRLPAQAVPHLEDAVRLEPANARFRYHLGTAYQRLGQNVKARDQLARAIAIDPAFPEAAAARTALNALAVLTR